MRSTRCGNGCMRMTVRTRVLNSSAAAKKYVDDTAFSYFDLRKAGVREEVPREDAFVTLRPGESYSLDKDGFGVRLYNGTKDSEDELQPGNYFLQLRVATWYYLVRPEDYRKRWRDKGYVWSADITSQPMPFTVLKKVNGFKDKS